MTSRTERPVGNEEFLKLRLYTQAQVLQMWPISRATLSRLTNHRSEDKRLPSYRIGKYPVYAHDELMWYREKHRFQPRERKVRK